MTIPGTKLIVLDDHEQQLALHDFVEWAEATAFRDVTVLNGRRLWLALAPRSKYGFWLRSMVRLRG